LKRKTLALITISVIIAGVGLYAFYIYAFTTNGIPTGTCPEFSFVSGPANIPFKMVTVGDPNSYRNGSGGTTSWCVYGANGLLLRSYQTNSILTGYVSASANGQYVAVSAFQRPTAGSTYGNSAIYFFDSSGRMLWNVSDSFPLPLSLINSNGSVVVGYGRDLYYINQQGQVLWNYSAAQSVTAALVNDGSYVVDGTSYVPQTYDPPNSTMVSSNLVLFDSTGKVVWNDSIPGQVIESANSVAVSNGHIALGVTQIAANQGTLLYYDLQGKLIWSKTINLSLANDHVYFQNNGSQIYVGWWTSGGHLIYDLNGNEIGS
jgi:hypothetical protein